MHTQRPANEQASERPQRLIAGWLPLAQEANAQYGWNLDAAALEALILHAAAALRQAESALAARAILWQRYQQQQREHAP